MSVPQAVVIWNSGAGSTESSEHVREQIIRHPEIALVASDSREAAQQAVRGAVASNVPRIIAAGGDGTVSAVVDALADCDTVTTDMAVLPLGTGNDLSRTLGMSLQPEEALQACLAGASTPMDVIRATSGSNSRNVANMATAGNSGRYAQVLTDEQKKAWGPFCYLRGVLDVLQDLQVFEIECRVDDGPAEQFRALNLFVANGRTSGGGVEVAPRAELADGMFDLVLIRDGSPLELATLTADYLLTSFLENDLVVWRQCRSLEVVAREPLPFSADGDILGNAPANFAIRPAAVRVVRGQ
ncbi:MAG: diacylglycerol kinase family lipid kinase [Planctomycetaceae bacterium]|nr:diacylglycerol kinase family lipid kinase [Planctomycetaceae bacterium]